MKSFIKITLVFLLSPLFYEQAGAQGVPTVYIIPFTELPAGQQPQPRDILEMTLTANYKELSGRSGSSLYEGEPTNEQIQYDVFSKLYKGIDQKTGRTVSWREGKFFIVGQSSTPIAFNVEYGYQSDVPGQVQEKAFKFDFADISVGDYSGGGSDGQRKTIRFEPTGSSFGISSNFFSRYRPDRFGMAFSVDVSKIHPNSSNAYTKLLIIRFYKSNKVAKTLILPITVVGNANSYATGAKYLSTGPGPRELNAVLRAVPGDGSRSFINTTKSYSSEIKMSLSTTEGSSTTLAYSVEAGMSAGPLSAGAEYEASKTNSYEATSGKEETYTVTYTNSSKIENKTKSDLFISTQYECEYGIGFDVKSYQSLNDKTLNAVIGRGKLLINPLRTLDNSNYYEDKLLSTTIPKLKAEKKLGEAKFWEDAIAYNNKVKKEAKIKRTFKGENSGEQSFTSETSSSVSLSQEVVISKETSQKITLSAGLEIGPVSASAEASAEQKFTFSSTKSFTNTKGKVNSIEVGYEIADDDKDDDFVVDIYEDGSLGSPVFKLDETQSATSCPYEGGTKLYSPGITVQDPVTKLEVKSAKQSGLLLDQETTFRLTLKNNVAKTARRYRLVVGSTANVPDVTIPANGIFDMAAGETRLITLKVRNWDTSTEFAYENFSVVLKPECDDDALSDTVFLSAYYGDTDISRPPDNDVVCSAVELPVDGSLQTKYTNKFGNSVNITNKNATADTQEKLKLTPTVDCTKGWCAETTDNKALINGSVWFKFTTISPTVVISTCYSINSAFDTQMAVYSATDCKNYTTYKFIAGNDNDNGCGVDGKNSRVVLENLPIGATYYVLVDGFKGVEGDFGISIASPTPTNDNSCSLEFLTVNGKPNQGALATGSNNPNFHYSNYLTTVETNEQILTPLSKDATIGWKDDLIQHSVWFAFEAPAGGEMTIDVANSTFDAQVSVYGTNGNICGPDYFTTYTKLGANDDISLAGGLDSRLVLTGLTPLKRYLILVDGYKGATGTFDMILSSTPPSNDEPCNAITLETDGVSKGVFRNSGASGSVAEQVIAPPYNMDGVKGWTDKPGNVVLGTPVRVIERSVWFKFVAPSSGLVTISTCNQADFALQLAAYQVSNCADFSKFKYITAEDNSGFCAAPADPQYPNGRNVRGSIINIDKLTPDSTYYILVDGGILDSGTFSMTLTTPPSSPPVNDDACKAIALPTTGVVQKGYTNVGATVTDKENAIAPTNKWVDATMNNTVWFTFVAPASGEAEISICDLANFDTQLAVYTATACGDFSTFTLVGANEDGPKYCSTKGDSFLPLTGLTPGKTYYIVVDGYAGFTGNFSILIKDKLTPGPVNDDVTKAFLLPVTNVVQKGYTNVFATATTLEQTLKPKSLTDCITGWCDSRIETSVWFKFVAPADGIVSVSTCDLANFDTQLAVYSATDVANFSTFTLIAANDAGPTDCSTNFDSYLPVKGLKAGQTYYVLVDGFDGDMGNFDISLSGIADTQAPSSATNLTASDIQATSAKVTWTAATDNVGIKEYRVYVDGDLKTTVTDVSVTLSGLTAATTYSIYIVAVDASGNLSANSTTLKVTTSTAPDTQAPSVPTNLVASATQTTSTTVTWTASTDNIGVKEYRVYVDGVLKTTTTNLSVTLSGFTAATAYTIYVVAVDAAGNVSVNSTSLKVTTSAAADTQAPSAPTNLVATDTKSTSITISWSASTDNVGVKEYRVYVDGALKSTTPDLSFTLTGLTTSTAYSIYVVAADAAGNVSAASASLKVTTLSAPDTQAPSSPTNLVASDVQTTSLKITWSASTDNVGVKEYRVYVDGALKTTTTDVSVTLSALTASTAYSIYVVAVDAAGNVSAASSSLKVTTNAVILSIEEVSISSQYEVFPNPFRDFVRIKFPKTVSFPDRIELIDIRGKVMTIPQQLDEINRIIQIDMTVYPVGMFFLMIESESGVIYKKIVKY